jgi:hypothetical protein
MVTTTIPSNIPTIQRSTYALRSRAVAEISEFGIGPNYLNYSGLCQKGVSVQGLQSGPQNATFPTGSTVQISVSNASTSPSCVFQNWIGYGHGSYSGPASAANVMMNGNVTEVAHFNYIPLITNVTEIQNTTTTTIPPSASLSPTCPPGYALEQNQSALYYGLCVNTSGNPLNPGNIVAPSCPMGYVLSINVPAGTGILCVVPPTTSTTTILPTPVAATCPSGYILDTNYTLDVYQGEGVYGMCLSTAAGNPMNTTNVTAPTCPSGYAVSINVSAGTGVMCVFLPVVTKTAQTTTTIVPLETVASTCPSGYHLNDNRSALYFGLCVSNSGNTLGSGSILVPTCPSGTRLSINSPPGSGAYCIVLPTNNQSTAGGTTYVTTVGSTTIPVTSTPPRHGPFSGFWTWLKNVFGVNQQR